MGLRLGPGLCEKSLPGPEDAFIQADRSHPEFRSPRPRSGLLFPNAREVWVNASEAPVRRRFTVGHELGHWVLHCRRGTTTAGGTVHCRDSEVREEVAGESAEMAETYLRYPPDELDANQFAAALLMPRAALADEAGESDELARRLGVSAEALRKRMWFLHEVDEART